MHTYIQALASIRLYVGLNVLPLDSLFYLYVVSLSAVAMGSRRSVISVMLPKVDYYLLALLYFKWKW